MKMGDHHDHNNVLCVDPGTAPGHPRKRMRVDKGDNGYIGKVYIQPSLLYPRYDLGLLSGAYQNVKAFNAVGDGVTDDTAAFQAALALQTKIFVPDGPYLISAPLVFLSGSGLVGNKGRSGLHMTSNAAGPMITLDDYGYLIDMGFTYDGTNYTTNTWVSIAGTSTLIQGCQFGGTNPNTPAFGLSYDTTDIYSYVQNNLVKSASKCVRFTAASARNTFHSNILICAGAGTNCIDTTNAGALNEFVNNIWNNEGGVPTNHVNLAVAATLIGNRSTSSIAYTGAGLATSLILDTQTRNTGWDGTFVGANKATALDATTITATDANIQDVTEVVNAMKSALIAQGIIGV